MLTRIKKALDDTEVVMLVVMFVFVVAFIIDVRNNPRAGRLFPTYVGLVTLILLAIESVITFRRRKKTAVEAASRPAEPAGGSEYCCKIRVDRFPLLPGHFGHRLPVCEFSLPRGNYVDARNQKKNGDLGDHGRHIGGNLYCICLGLYLPLAGR